MSSSPSPHPKAAIGGRSWLLWGAAVVLAALPMLPTLVTPVCRDQGLFCYYGWRLLSGDAPYLQVWDHKPPGIHLSYALALAVGGLKYMSVIWLTLLLRLATGFLLGRTLLHLTGRRGVSLALLLAFCVVVLPFDGRFWDVAQPEAFINFFLAASLLAALNKKALLAGAILVMACWFKPIAVVWGLLVWPASAGYFDESDRRKLFPGPLVRVILGAVAGCLPFVMWLAARGALEGFWQAVVNFNSFHAGGEVFVDRWVRSLAFCREAWLPCLLAIAAIALAVRPRPWRRETGFFAAWLLAAGLAVGLQQKCFGYHLILLLPPLCALAVIGVVDLWRNWIAVRPVGLRAAAIGLLGLLVVVWFQPLFSRNLSFPYQRFAGRLEEARFESAYRAGTDFSHPANVEFARWITDCTGEDDFVQIMGFEPGVNFLALRRASSRYCFDYPINFRAHSERAIRWRRQARRQLREDLQKNPPRVLALLMRDANAIEDEATARQMLDIPWFKELVERRYEPVGQMEDFIVFRLQENR